LHVHIRIGDRQDALLDQGLPVRVLDEVVDRLVQHDARPQDSLQHRAGRLARAKAGDARAAREAPDGVVDSAGEAFRG
jgi:hypothetical protein